MSDGTYLSPIPRDHFCRPPDPAMKGARWLCECGSVWTGVDLYDALPSGRSFRHPYDAAVWRGEAARERRIREGRPTLGDRFAAWFLSEPNPSASTDPDNKGGE